VTGSGRSPWRICPHPFRGNLVRGFPTDSGDFDQAARRALTEVERRLIETPCDRHESNKSRAAEMLGISRPRLYRRIKELNLPDDAESLDEIETSH